MNNNKKKVLVLEQNHSLGFVIKTVLNEVFFTIAVSNPFDAMEVLSQEDISCIVLGVDKDNSKTQSFLQHLKSSSLLKNIPLVVLTDMEESVFNELCGSNVVDVLFKKPFDPLKVRNSIEGLCHPVDTSQIIFRKKKILNMN